MTMSHVAADICVAFVGLGQMGSPMSARLLQAGYRVRGHDLSESSIAAFVNAGGIACSSPADAATGASILITMLPNSRIVRDVIVGSGNAAGKLDRDALVIDMSSSAPFQTKSLGEDLFAMGIGLIDAPVSGGVRRAVDGTLTVMAGGDAEQIDRVSPMLGTMGKAIYRTGGLGSGHALKALNNYVSAAGLAAASEAIIAGQAFGLSPEIIVDVLNASTGRNNSTETKMKPFVLSRTFASGFSMALMAKDIRVAADFARNMGQQLPGVDAAADLWEQAAEKLGKGADHTAIFSYLEQISSPDR